MKNLKYYLAIPWIALVVGFYFKSSFSYLISNSGKIQSLLLPFLLISLACGALYLGFIYIFNGSFKNKVLNFKIRPVSILGIVVLTILTLITIRIWTSDPGIYRGNTIVERDGFVTELTENEEVLDTDFLMAEKNTFLTSSQKASKGAPDTFKRNLYTIKDKLPITLWNVFLNIIFVFGAIYILFTTFFIVGTFISDKLHLYEEDAAENYLLDFGFGFVFFMFLIFILAAFGVWNFYTSLALILIPNLILFKRSLQVAKSFFTYKIAFSFKPFSVVVFAVLAVLLVFSFNFITNLRNMPSGWDDTTRYVLLPKLIGTKGVLARGFNPDAFALIMSIGYALFDSCMITMYISIFMGVLATFAIYNVLNKFTSKESSFIFASFFYTLPMVFFQSSVEVKTDMCLLFFAILSIFAFLKYRKKDSLKWLAICGLFAGLALSIKLTALIFIFGIFVLLAYRDLKILGAISVSLLFASLLFLFNRAFTFSHLGNGLLISIGIVTLVISLILGVISLLKQKKKISNTVKKFVLFGGVVCIMFAPWAMKNIIEYNSFNLYRILAGVSPIRYVDLAVLNDIPSDINIQVVEDRIEWDFSRYIPKFFENKTLNALAIPWGVTIKDNVISPYVDISFLFLAFLPIVLILYRKKLDDELVLFFYVYWIYWWIASSGVIWYGIAGFIPALIFLAILFNEKTSALISYIFKALLIIWFVFAIGYRVSFFNASYFYSIFKYAGLSDEVDSYKFLDTIYHGQLSALEFIDWENLSNDEKIYMPHGQILFFIDDFRNIVFDMDSRSLIYLFHERENLVADFKKMGIKYIFFTEIESVAFNDELKEFPKAFRTFAEENFKTIGKSGMTYLFEID